jgi:hypothetical protein
MKIMKNDGYEPAFPCTAVNGATYSGMTLRDYFSAKALVGLLNNTELTNLLDEHRVPPEKIPSFVAAKVFEIADAMIEERNK